MNLYSKYRIILFAILLTQPWLHGQQGPGLQAPLTLEAKDAALKGPALHYNPTVRRLVDWQNLGDIATFDLPELPAGEYALSLSYTAGTNSGGRLRLNWNDKAVKKTIRQTGSWAKAEDLSFGILKHDGGAVSLSLQAESIDKAALMEFVSLTIKQTSILRSPAGIPKTSPQNKEAQLKGSVPTTLMVEGKAAGTEIVPATAPTAMPEEKLKGSADSGRVFADWDFSKATKNSQSITIPNGPDLFGGPLVADDPAWAEIVADPTAPQGRAVRFDGSSKQQLATKAEIEIEKGTEVQIEIDINPSESSDSQQRIFRFAGSFDLRLRPESNGIEFLVWNAANKYSVITGQLTFGAWNNVVVTYKEGLLEITINGETIRKTLPADMIMQAGNAKALVAHSFQNQSFLGSIGRIRMTTRKAAKSDQQAPEASVPTPPTPEISEVQAVSPLPPTVAPTPVTSSTPQPATTFDEPVINWDFTKARISGSRISVPGTPGFRVEKQGATLKDWASIQEDRSAPGGRSLQLAGGPEQSLSSVNDFAWAEGQPIRIEMEVNPSSAMKAPVPILRSAVFDVGYVPDRQSLNFIVYHKDGYTVATAPAAPDAWHNVVAECSGGVLELTVDGQTTRAGLPEGVVMKAGEERTFFAFPRNGNSFQGSVSRVAFFTKSKSPKENN